MLGWEIFIHTELSESRNQEDWHWPKDENVLATWRANVAGINWLKKLVKDGRAEYLGGNGYPERYLAKHKDLMPIIKQGPPTDKGPMVIGENYFTPSGWVSEAIIKLDRFEQIHPDDVLVIDAWDED